MHKIYKIPVLGYIIRIIVSFVKLPKQVDVFGRDLECVQRQVDLLGNDLKSMQSRIDVQEKIVNAQKAELEDKCKKIVELQLKIEDRENKMLYERFESILGDSDCLERLNRQLSIHPTIWGDKERLHISPLSAVFPCFFNTNSGEITVGDYTFAGSRVSLLAGSHDMFLEGLSRRDAEIKQGCDIVIGRGVWMASGCTILGPCSIGDNAVVAAGAVVVPGTIIPADTVYAGVPAKMIRKIEVGTGINDQHIIEAAEREKGALFVDGWSEKRPILHRDTEVWGHWILRSGAQIYTSKEKLNILCHKDMEEPIELVFEQGAKRKCIVVEGDMEFEISVERNANALNEVIVNYDDRMPIKLFLAVM